MNKTKGCLIANFATVPCVVTVAFRDDEIVVSGFCMPGAVLVFVKNIVLKHGDIRYVVMD
ncbi:hypothetical protein RS167_26070 (plasmid) [Escherichia coli]|uniref:hypothetical protein n=1 Tax=Escherichia coli TaxID=562 RepID=UPI0028E2C808|nr:hypothetical protein [Escherichia coli]WNU49376.1 hypothetical protein RS167_26070 [Escherichia coli]